MNRYTVELADAVVDVAVRALDSGRFEVQIADGKPMAIEADIRADGVHILHDHRSFAFRTGQRDAGVHLHSDGFDAKLTVFDPHQARRRQRGAGLDDTGDGQIIKSPMPGKVVMILVEVGQIVEPGQGVAMVEAMKMENELRVAERGVVAKVCAAAGDLVEANAELVIIGRDESED